MSYHILSPEEKIAILERRLANMQTAIANCESREKYISDYRVYFRKLPFIKRRIEEVNADNFCKEEGYYKFYKEFPWYEINSNNYYFRKILLAQFDADSVSYVKKI